MSVVVITEGLNKIWSRLFDHREFVKGEVTSFVREFEQKTGDKEVDNLFSIIENITDIKCTQTQRLKQVVEQTVPDSLCNLEAALESSDKFVCSENFPGKEAILQNNRQIRKANWDSFMNSITTEYSAIDSIFEIKKENLKEQYNKLEKQLNIVPH